jgi:hypothetical protein
MIDAFEYVHVMFCALTVCKAVLLRLDDWRVNSKLFAWRVV